MVDRILVVDDEPIVVEVLQEVLASEGFHVTPAKNARVGLDILARDPHDLVLCDIRMPDVDGFELLKQVRRAYPATDVVLMTGFATVDGAIDAMALGAADYLIKPLKPKEVIARIRAILQRRGLEAELHTLQSELRGRYEIHNIVALSPRMRAVAAAVRRIADQDDSVVLCGEPGSGRMFLARAVHHVGKRRDQPIATIEGSNPFHNDLAAELFGVVKNGRRVQRGQLERCKDGTVYIADFELLPTTLQTELGAALSSGRFTSCGGEASQPLTARVIVSMSAQPIDLIDRGALHRELDQLISAVTINVPPLRERRQDLPGLASAFANDYSAERGQRIRIEPDAVEAFADYDFPGNVAEFFTLLGHAAKNSLDGAITRELAERSLRQARVQANAPAPMSDHLDDREFQLVLRAVNRHPGRLDQAARELGISRTTLWRRMRKYDIKLASLKRPQPIE